MTLISIVTPSLDQSAFLEDALSSVVLQQHPAVEHLVLDGGSSDGTLDLLRGKTTPEWAHLQWFSAPDRGQSEAVNKGLRLARGEIVGWLNSDDRYRPGCFRRILRAFAENPGVDVFYGDYTFIDAEGKLTHIRREIAFSYFVLLYHHTPYVPTASAFFRRRIFDEGNFLDERFHYAMDHEFYLRLARKGYVIRHLPQVLADFRLHPASKTCTAAHSQLEEKRVATNAVSSLARNSASNWICATCFLALKGLAGLRRYFEKLLRGYYWTQRRPQTLAGGQ